MKLIMIIVIILKFTTTSAGSIEQTVVSTVDVGFLHDPNIILPTTGQSFRAWVPWSCSSTSDFHVDIMNNDIKVFVENRPGTICPSPPPPIYVPVAEISGLAAGSYDLTRYSVPEGDDFPPAVADYPNYFRDNIQFEVLGAPAIIDSTTNSGLALLILLLFITGFYFRKPTLLKLN